MSAPVVVTLMCTPVAAQATANVSSVRLPAVMLAGIYGLLCASFFVAMDAVDVAFTEAAVGAGVTPLLMLATLRLVGNGKPAVESRPLIAVLVTLVSAVAPRFSMNACLRLWPLTVAKLPVATNRVPSGETAMCRTLVSSSGLTVPATVIDVHPRSLNMSSISMTTSISSSIKRTPLPESNCSTIEHGSRGGNEDRADDTFGRVIQSDFPLQFARQALFDKA